jgi:hypothetical protein
VDVASRDVGTALGLLANRVDDLRGEMRDGFQDVRAEVRAIRVRLDTLLLATIGVIATLAVKL